MRISKFSDRGAVFNSTVVEESTMMQQERRCRRSI